MHYMFEKILECQAEKLMSILGFCLTYIYMMNRMKIFGFQKKNSTLEEVNTENFLHLLG